MHVALAQELEARGAWNESLSALTDARSRFPDDFNLALFERRFCLLQQTREIRAIDDCYDLTFNDLLARIHIQGDRPWRC